MDGHTPTKKVKPSTLPPLLVKKAAKIVKCEHGNCAKAYKHKKSMKRHVVKCHQQQSTHPLEQTEKTEPFIFPVFNESDKIPEVEEYNKDVCFVSKSEFNNAIQGKLPENLDYAVDSHDLIVTEFLRYYSDKFINVRTIGKIANLLIARSKLEIQNESNYYAALFTLIELFEENQEFTAGTMLNDLAHRLVKVAKNDGISFWDMMIIVFTLAYKLLQKYPHQYLEIREMLVHFLRDSTEEIERLGGWENF